MWRGLGRAYSESQGKRNEYSSHGTLLISPANSTCPKGKLCFFFFLSLWIPRSYISFSSLSSSFSRALLIWKVERQKEGIFRWFLYSPNGRNSQVFARRKPGGKDSIQISYMGGRDPSTCAIICCLARCKSWSYTRSRAASTWNSAVPLCPPLAYLLAKSYLLPSLPSSEHAWYFTDPFLLHYPLTLLVSFVSL